jgi:hypothetical protein
MRDATSCHEGCDQLSWIGVTIWRTKTLREFLSVNLFREDIQTGAVAPFTRNTPPGIAFKGNRMVTGVHRLITDYRRSVSPIGIGIPVKNRIPRYRYRGFRLVSDTT